MLTKLIKLFLFSVVSAQIKLNNREKGNLEINISNPLKEMESINVNLHQERRSITFVKKLSLSKAHFYGENKYSSLNLMESKDSVTGKKTYFGSLVDTENQMVHQIRPDVDGNIKVYSIPVSNFPEEADPENDDYLYNMDKAEPKNKDYLDGKRERTSIHPPSENGRSVNSILDIMVVWTKKAECRNSNLESSCTPSATTTNNMHGLIDLAVYETNTAYQLSGIQTEIRLVHSYLDSSYTETSDNTLTTFVDALNHIKDPSDGFMDDVHSKRTEFGADLVALIIGDDAYCGYAYIGPSITLMFSVTSYNCATGYFSFGHEIGHNLGCYHDRGSTDECNNNDYRYGWRDEQAQFRTIMAYNCVTGQCDNNPGGGCNRIQRFSTPNFSYNDKPLGNSFNDCARRINEVSATVEGFFAVVPTCTSDDDCDDSSTCADVSCIAGACTYDFDGDRELKVEIFTDNYPTETSWGIYPESSSVPVMSGQSYSAANRLYISTDNLVACTYTFTITDDYGDGICCGEGNGYYKVYADGIIVLTGGQFGASESKIFEVSSPSESFSSTKKTLSPIKKTLSPTKKND